MQASSRPGYPQNDLCPVYLLSMGQFSRRMLYLLHDASLTLVINPLNLTDSSIAELLALAKLRAKRTSSQFERRSTRPTMRSSNECMNRSTRTDFRGFAQVQSSSETLAHGTDGDSSGELHFDSIPNSECSSEHSRQNRIHQLVISGRVQVLPPADSRYDQAFYEHPLTET